MHRTELLFQQLFTIEVPNANRYPTLYIYIYWKKSFKSNVWQCGETKQQRREEKRREKKRKEEQIREEKGRETKRKEENKSEERRSENRTSQKKENQRREHFGRKKIREENKWEERGEKIKIRKIIEGKNQKKEDQRREKIRIRKIKVGEKVDKLRNCVVSNAVWLRSYLGPASYFWSFGHRLVQYWYGMYTGNIMWVGDIPGSLLVILLAGKSRSWMGS